MHFMDLEIKIAFPDQTFIVLNGCFSKSVHFFLTLLGLIHLITQQIMVKHFFPTLLLKNEVPHYAAEDAVFSEFVLRLCRKEKGRIAPVIADNAILNRALAQDCGSRFADYYFYRLNLAI